MKVHNFFLNKNSGDLSNLSAKTATLITQYYIVGSSILYAFL